MLYDKNIILDIPVIDIEGLRVGTSEEAMIVAKQLGEACRNVGFFYVKNHGIDSELIDQTFDMANNFFSLPLNQKLNYLMEKNSYCFRGYSPVLSELADGKRNSYELMEFSVDFDPTSPEVIDRKPMHGPNVWPEIPNYRNTITSYIDEMNNLGFHLMRGIALSLNLEQDFFYKAFNGKSFWQFRTVNYPEATDVDQMSKDLPEFERRMESIERGDHNCGAHTDYGCLTILLANSEGLQILGKNDKWFDAPVIPDTYICNIGDMLQYWTKDLYVATKHRVLTGNPRISLPFFFQPDYETVVQPIESTKGIREKKFSAVKYGTYAYKNYKSIYPACPTYENI